MLYMHSFLMVPDVFLVYQYDVFFCHTLLRQPVSYAQR